MKFKIAAISIFLFFTACIVHAQRATNIGFTGGAARYYPDLDEKFSTSRNDAMDSGFGFSAGVFIEDYWKPKIHQIIEVNFLSLYSDVFLENNPVGPGGYGTGNGPVYWDFGKTAFNYFAISGGIKYFLNDRLFIYPGIEWARALTNEVDMNKNTYHLKLAAGVNTRICDIILEYNYGLRTQRRIFDSTIPLIGTYRNMFLQLKVQVPLYRLK